jgi:hypothetical protein
MAVTEAIESSFNFSFEELRMGWKRAFLQPEMSLVVSVFKEMKNKVACMEEDCTGRAVHGAWD